MVKIKRIKIADGQFGPEKQYPPDTIRVYIDATHYICYQVGDILPPEPVLEG